MTQPQYNGDLRFPHGSGVVEALQNDLTLKASSSGHILVAFPAAMRPEVDISQDLGRPDLRWRNLHVSGINDIPIAQFVSIDTQTTINGLSGAVTLTSPNNSIFIGDNGQSIELSGIFTAASGALLQQNVADIASVSGTAAGLPQKVVLEFTETSGTSFVMYHGLSTSNWTFNMWQQDSPGGNVQGYTIPNNVRPSGVDHVEVDLASAMFGTLILIG